MVQRLQWNHSRPVPWLEDVLASPPAGNMADMYETFEYTADLALRIRARDLDTLFAEAAEALFSAIVEDLSSIEPRQHIGVSLPADDIEYLFFDWLKALLLRFDTEHLLLGRFEVTVTAEGLKGAAWGEPLDP